MARRDRVRKTPGSRPADGCPGDGFDATASCHNSTAFCAGRSGVYRSAATRPPLPAGVLLAMAATGGKGVCAFAPPTPAERPGIGTMCRADASKDGGGSRWPRLTASGRGLREMTSTSSRRPSDYGPRWRGGAGRRDGCTHRGEQAWLTAAARTEGTGQVNPDANPYLEEAASSSSTRNPRVASTSTTMNDTSRRQASAGRDPAPRAWSRSRPRPDGAREQRWKKEGDDGQSRRGAGGGLMGKKTLPPELAELAAFRAAEETPPASATNNTELTQKVEAQLFEEYDVMVPGPASSMTAVSEGSEDVSGGRNKGGGSGGTEKRTGRPLSINLDLLSYSAKQKALKGDFVAAQKLYRDCVELDPRDGRGWLGLARQMQKRQKFEKAQRLFEAGLENCVDNPYLLQAFAVMEEQRGNQANALNLLNRSVRVHPEHTASWVALGLLNERDERVDEARACFETATKNDPKSYYAWLVWGMLEKRIGSKAQAREKFKTCLRVNPRNAKIYQAWGVLESEEDNFELAAELFRAGLEQQPSNTFVMQAWALMEVRRGNRDSAIRLLKQALVERPRDGAVWQTYALILKDMGDIAGARALFKKGVEQAPKHSPTWQAWGMLEWEQGNVSTARKLFQEGVWESPREPNVVRILQAWAILEASEQNYNDARKYFGFALARDPYSIPVIVAWALVEESLGDISRARQLLEIATKTQPGNVEIWNVYEQVEGRGGFEAEAKAVYERGVMALKRENDDARRGDGGKAWWDRGRWDPSSRGMPSLLDQASRSLGKSSADMSLRVSRIVGGVQWASDYMSFSALGSSRGVGGGEMAFEP